MGPEVDVRQLNQLSAENLRVVLRKIPGSKDLILQPELMKPMDKFAGMSLIKSCGVERIFKLESNVPPESTTTKVYMVTPDVSVLNVLVSHLHHQSSNVHVIVLPKILSHVHTLFEEEGLFDKVSLHSYMWELMPLDHDILCMELPHLFGDLFLLDDSTQLSAVPRALSGLQSLFGLIPNRFAIGNHSVACLQQLSMLEETQKKSIGRLDIGNLVLIDRSVDWATCLLSPMTYESLLDESYGIKCGVVELTGADGKDIKVPLNSIDKIFVKIRNKTMGPEIFDTLSSLTKQLKQLQSKMTGGGVSVSEMKTFVQNNLKDAQGMSKSINLHMNALEKIMNEKGPIYARFQPIETSLLLNTQGCYKDAISCLDDAISQKMCIKLVLRILCLTSHCCNGIYSSDFERLKKLFLQTYGFENLLVFNLLIRAGLLSVKDSASSAILSTATRKVQQRSPRPNFHTVTKKLNPESHPSAYVFNGSYCPLSIRLVSEVMKAKVGGSGYQVVEDLVKDLQVKSSRSQTSASDANKLTMEASKTVLVFFVGGYTMSEVAAFRQLQTSTGYHFIISGTSNLSGRHLAESILQSALV